MCLKIRQPYSDDRLTAAYLVWQGTSTVKNLLAQLFKLHLPGRAWLSWQSTHFREIFNIFQRISIFGSGQQVIIGYMFV